MRFIKEKHQFGLFNIAHLRQSLKQLREQPEQESGIQAGGGQQLVGCQNIDDSFAIDRLHEISNIEHRLTEEDIAALFFDLHQPALNGANRGSADVAVFGGELPSVVAHLLAHGAQVFHV